MGSHSDYVDARLIQLSKITDERGALTFAQVDNIPFAIQRCYWLYDIHAGATRAGHAHHKMSELLIALSGSFTVDLDDGHHNQSWHLFLPYCALYVPSMLWRTIRGFSSGAVCLALADAPYDEQDYIRNYDDFIRR